jgi:hypothetical protein
MSTYLSSFRNLPFMGKLSQDELALGVHLSFIFWKSSLLVQLQVHLSIIFLKSSKTNVHCLLADQQ